MSLLGDFKTFLKSHNLLVEKPICQIYKSCCNSKIMIVDFDHIKDKFCKMLGISPLKSSDCLYLNETKNELLFVEMKDLDQHVHYQRKKFSALDDKAFMDQSFDKFELENKIIDSYMIVLSIIGYYSYNKTFYADYLDKKRLKIKFILLANISSRDYIKYRIAYLPSLQKINFRFLSGKANIIMADDFDTLISLSLKNESP